MRRIATALAALAVAAAAALTAATPAAATTGVLYTVTATNSEFNGDAEVVLTCGTDLMFGVGFSDTGGALVKVDRLEPTSAGTVTVHASDKLPGPTDGPPPTGWSLTGYAVCGPSQTRVTNLTVVDSPLSTTGTSTAGAAVTAYCPSSAPTPIGGGWRINALGTDRGGITVTDMTVSSVGTTVAAAPQDAADGSVPSPWTVTAVAICAKVSSLSTVRYVSAVATANPASQTKYVDCGSTESRASAGFYVTSSTGDNVVDSLRPSVNILGTLQQGRATVDTVQDGSGYYANWGLKVSAVCITI